MPHAESAPPSSLADAIGQYLHSMALSGRSPCTLRNARGVLREFADLVLGMNLPGIQALAHGPLLRYREHLAQRLTASGTPLQAASQCEYLGCLKSFCRWIVDQDWLAGDPMRRIPLPRRLRQLPRTILEPAEVALLCSLPDLGTIAGFRDRVVLEILYSSALRRAELASLRLGELDTRRGYVLVRQGKNRKDRVVPMGDAVCRLVERYVAEARPHWRGAAESPYLLLNRFGGGIQPIGIWHIVHKYARRSGIGKPISTHTLRHSCATHMARAGAPIRHLQELLGHASIETTQIYTHLTMADLKEAHMRFHPGERTTPGSQASVVRQRVP